MFHCTARLVIIPEGDKESRDGIHKIFNLFDDDKTGSEGVGNLRATCAKALSSSDSADRRSISLKNLKRVSKELGETMTEEARRGKRSELSVLQQTTKATTVLPSSVEVCDHFLLNPTNWVEKNHT